MFGRFSRKDISPPEIDALRNQAVVAWIRTFPVDAKLQEFISELPPALQNNVRASATAIFSAASDYLEKAAGLGVVNLDEFYPALKMYLKARFPWMNDPAFAALRSYTGWYAWHEGYSANAV